MTQSLFTVAFIIQASKFVLPTIEHLCPSSLRLCLWIRLFLLRQPFQMISVPKSSSDIQPWEMFNINRRMRFQMLLIV